VGFKRSSGFFVSGGGGRIISSKSGMGGKKGVGVSRQLWVCKEKQSATKTKERGKIESRKEQ